MFRKFETLGKSVIGRKRSGDDLDLNLILRLVLVYRNASQNAVFRHYEV